MRSIWSSPVASAFVVSLVLWSASGKPAHAACTAGTTTPTTACPVKLWPSGIIRYQFVTGTAPNAVPAVEQMRIRNAMDQWENATGRRIQFIPDSSNSERVVIDWDPSRNTCRSDLGDDGKSGTTRTMTFGSSQCLYAHELGHIIGLYHEHQRADRDRYVTINRASQWCTDNDVLTRCIFTEDGGSDIGEYDFKAVCAYGPTFLDCSPANPPAITRNDNKNDCTTAPGDGFPGCYCTATAVSANAKDGEAAKELYSRQYGAWKRFRSVGAENGSTQARGPNFIPGQPNGVRIAQGSSPATVRNSVYLDTFALGSDNAIWWRYSQDDGVTWTDWSSLGPFLISSPGATVLNGGDYVCAVGSDNAVWCNWEMCGKGVFCGWGSLGQPDSTVWAASAPAVASWGTNRVDVFVRGSDNQLWWRSYTGQWGDWTPLGGQITGTPAAVSRTSGVINVVVNTATGELWHRPFFNGGWRSWSRIGCCLAAESGPAIAGRSGRLDVFLHGSDNGLWWMWWTPDKWNGPLAVGGVMVSDPAAAARAGSTRVDVFKIGTDGALWYRWLN